MPRPHSASIDDIGIRMWGADGFETSTPIIGYNATIGLEWVMTQIARYGIGNVYISSVQGSKYCTVLVANGNSATIYLVDFMGSRRRIIKKNIPLDQTTSSFAALQSLRFGKEKLKERTVVNRFKARLTEMNKKMKKLSLHQ